MTIKKAKWAVGLCLLSGLLLSADVARAGLIWPGAIDQKWEVSLDGFHKLYVDNPQAPTKLLLRSLTHIDSDFKGQGTFNPTPAPFVIGLDGNPGGIHNPVAADVSYTGVLATLITGMKVIGLDILQGAGAFNLITGDANILGYLAANTIQNGDIVYFGADGTATPHGLLYYDPLLTEDDLGPADGWNGAGDMFTTAAGSIGAGDAESILELDFTFQDLGGLEVDSTFRAAMAGALIAEVASAGDVRPFLMADVVGGTQYTNVKQNGMTFGLGTDLNNDGYITVAERNAKTALVGELAMSLGSTLPDGSGFVTLSDPAEFVSTPEPASLLVWGALGLLGVYSARRRRKA